MNLSLKSLRAFETAARRGSFKEAASELHLTPTAISHQIRSLEETLGHRLFHRKVRQVELTAEGEELARTLTPSFQAIDTAVGKLMNRPNRHTVTLGAGPIFAARWLAPRLGMFWGEHPDVDLRLHHSPLPVHQQMERYDLAVAWGNDDWPGLQADFLLRVAVTPVYASSMPLGISDEMTPDELLGLPLLHHRDQSGWQHWFAAAGVTAPTVLSGPIFEDANVLLQAALEGQGVALGFLPLIADEISGGRLIQPWTMTVEPKESYYLLYQQGNVSRSAVSRVRDWLLSIKA